MSEISGLPRAGMSRLGSPGNKSPKEDRLGHVTFVHDPSTAKSTVPICSPSGVCSSASAMKEAGSAPWELVTVDDASWEEAAVDAVSVGSPVINAAEDSGPLLPLPLPHPAVVTVTAKISNLPPGFKGFHLHSIGKCEPNSADPSDPSKTGNFLSAGGHLGANDAAHPGHQGDLTSLQVRSDGSAELVTTTDAFDMNAVLDADGSAVIVHAGPDNFGNIPSRYAPAGPDAKTQATGDAGDRAACGVVRALNS